MKKKSDIRTLLILGAGLACTATGFSETTGGVVQAAAPIDHATGVVARADKEVDVKTQVMVSPLAGRWYPADPSELAQMIARLMPAPRPAPIPGVCAILVPHAGYQYSGKVAARVYASLDATAFDRVVILGPSHSVAMRNAVSIPDATVLETPLGRVNVDTECVAALRASRFVKCVPRAHASEHSDQIQLPLVQTIFGSRIKVVSIVVGQFDPPEARAFADTLRPLLDSRTLVVASSDFTHYGPNYGYVPFVRDVPKQIEALDRMVFSKIVARDAVGFDDVMEQTQDTVCGRYPISILLDLLPDGAKVTEIAYDTSGRIMNDWENSVSYFGAVFSGDWRKGARPAATAETQKPDITPLDEEDQRQLLKLARATVEHAVKFGDPPNISDTGVTIRPGMKQIMGGFVTLNIGRDLRGCIGEIFPRREIWKVVREQAVNAAIHDPRFEPVRPSETSRITIEISALTPPRPVASYKDIVIGKHGMTLTKGDYSAVFLPQVAPEQGWDLPTTLTHLACKAGLPPDAWKTNATFTVFEAQVFHEQP